MTPAERARRWCWPALIAGIATPAIAQQPPQSLVVNPQQGATPRPAAPLPTPLPAPAPTLPASPALPAGPVPLATPVLPFPRETPAAVADRPAPLPRRRADGLPAPVADPLAIDPARDPVLALARAEMPMGGFQRAIGEAVRRHPELDEAEAQVAEARAARGEAQARGLPTTDLSVSSFQVIDRAFSNDPNNILERSRPRQRTDLLVRLQQPLFNFGALRNRIRAADARVDAARAGVEDTGTQVALRAVAAWYDVYGYRALARIADAFTAGQRDLRRSLDDRIEAGVAAPGDAAQVDGYLASAEAQLADFRRRLAGAEAQYAAVVGAPPPADLTRAPPPSLAGITAATLAADTERLPAVRAALASVDAARQDARAVRGDRLPQLSGAIDAGRYGVIENARDYDVRGSMTLALRLGGGANERVAQADARTGGADARLRRTRIESQRGAEVALADIAALTDAKTAIGANYVASRRARDVLAERFRVSRGTLFDLLLAEVNYFGVAGRYLQTVIELDTARYVLLARTGRLLPALGLDPATLGNP